MYKFSRSGQSNKSQGGNAQPQQITVNIVVTLQQSNINMQMQIDPDIPFNIYIQGIKESIFAQRMQSQYQDTIGYFLKNRGQIDESETSSLQQLGFTNNCTLYIKLRLKGGLIPSHKMNVNIFVPLQQGSVKLQVQIDPYIPFIVFIHGIKEQIFAQRMKNDYEDEIEYQLENGGLINEDDIRELRELGFTSGCTLYVRLKPKKSINYTDFTLNHGNELYSQKRYKEAIQFYDQAIQFNQQNPDFYFGKGKALLALNRRDEALKLYEQAYEKLREFVLQMRRSMNMFGN